jgi:glycosyltransferase involved in cell wall biosynthesis
MNQPTSRPKIFIIATHPPGYPSGAAVSVKYRLEKLSQYFDLYFTARVRTDKGTPSNYFKKELLIKKTSKKNFLVFIYRYFFKTLYFSYHTILSENIKIIQIEHVKNLVYALFYLPLRIFFGVKVYYTAHDLFATYHHENTLKHKMFKLFELSFFNLCIDKVFVWGQDDKNTLLSWGMDPEKVMIMPLVMPPKDTSWVKKETTDYLFIGTLGHAPNEESLRFILDSLWDSILQKTPDSKLYLVLGKDSDKFHTDKKNVINCGYVDKMEDAMDKANISLAPIFSGVGIKTKIAESFAYGIPVITTDFGLQNFDNLDKQKLLIANTATEFLRVIDSINDGKIDLDSISAYERNYCETKLSDSVIEKYRKLFI